jgi:hypothetical protein
MEVSGELHALADLPPGKEPLLPIGPPSRSGRGGEEKNSHPQPGRNPIVQPVAKRYTDSYHGSGLHY